MIYIKPTPGREDVLHFAQPLIQLVVLFLFVVVLQLWVHVKPSANTQKCSVIQCSPETVVLVVLRHHPKIAVITTAIGKYEKRTKNNIRQTLQADYYCFTDSQELQNPGNWTLDYTAYHLMNFTNIDNGNYRNSRCRNTHTYMVHKFYKMQFHHIPRLHSYDMILWMDMTFAIRKADVLERLWSIFEINPKRQMILRSHHVNRHCTVQREVQVSVGDHRWRQTFMMNQWQPFQDVRSQYDFYLRNGYNEEFWTKDNLSYRQNACIGLWQCNFIAYRMADPLIPQFLDGWYFEQLNQTTQDQISFPYVAQKLKIYPYTLPDNNYDPGSSLKHVRHGI
jgi:hypothetical protein